jgi:predicted  nucleic acid-binding Zn-ribbon protein
MRKLNTAKFVERANKVHNYRYDYTATDYKLSSLPVIITCRVHGDFSMTPNAHTSVQQGCPKCGDEHGADIRRVGTEEFIKRAKAIHGNQYSYDKVVYKTTHDKVTITCPKHGDFQQKPNTHVSQKNGCPDCGRSKRPGRYMPWHFKTNEQKVKPGVFYVLKFTRGKEEFIKIGITANSIRERYAGKKKGYRVEVLTEEPTTLHLAYLKEEQLKQKLKQYQYNPKHMNEGHTECYSVDCLDCIR